ncbi:hypothetical protein SAMN05216387_1201, partial [Nitrosovibrio tenuis]
MDVIAGWWEDFLFPVELCELLQQHVGM